MRIAVEVDIRPATACDTPALAAWSGLEEQVYRPALQSVERVL